MRPKPRHAYVCRPWWQSNVRGLDWTIIQLVPYLFVRVNKIVGHPSCFRFFFCEMHFYSRKGRHGLPGSLTCTHCGSQSLPIHSLLYLVGQSSFLPMLVGRIIRVRLEHFCPQRKREWRRTVGVSLIHTALQWSTISFPRFDNCYGTRDPDYLRPRMKIHGERYR